MNSKSRSYKMRHPKIGLIELTSLVCAAWALSGCGASTISSTTGTSATNASSTTTTTSSAAYVETESPVSGSYSNVPTSVVITFSGNMSASTVTNTANWSFNCGGAYYQVYSVSGSGSIYTVSLGSVSASITNGSACTLSSYSLYDANGNLVSADIIYYYNSSSSSTSGNSSDPAYTFSFENTGPSGTYTASGIDTDNLLQVTVTLGQPTIITGTGYTAEYSCAKFNVSMGGYSQTVFLSNTGSPGVGYCQGAVTSQMVDFSSRLVSGHGAESVTVTNVSYDNCRLYGDVYGTGCPQTSVYTTHTLTGSLSIAVNSE